jgi:hypothetical protein
MPSARLAQAVAAAWLVLAVVAGACGGEPPAASRPAATAASRPAATPSRTPAASPRTPTRRRIARAHCAASAVNCAAVTGRVLYVEAVDPDGDGDAHYVLLGGAVTAPGVTVVDVEWTLRPRRLPRVGELVSAAGPVYPGSYGQHQIQAVELHHER